MESLAEELEEDVSTSISYKLNELQSLSSVVISVIHCCASVPTSSIYTFRLVVSIVSSRALVSGE